VIISGRLRSDWKMVSSDRPPKHRRRTRPCADGDRPAREAKTKNGPDAAGHSTETANLGGEVFFRSGFGGWDRKLRTDSFQLDSFLALPRSKTTELKQSPAPSVLHERRWPMEQSEDPRELKREIERAKRLAAGVWTN
jgi:hypothetical protein